MANKSSFANKHIGLALSGGGVRAIAYHAGVMRWFAENGLLDSIEHISSVSGGSLFTGLVFRMSDYKWPTASHYLESVLPEIRKILTKESLQADAFYSLLLIPSNWRFLLSRANVVAISIERLWGVTATLEQLPKRPVWSINGTTAENGRRFRFKRGIIGDYEIGYADASQFKLAAAMAVSAAFPGGIGPLAIKAKKYQWRKREGWDITLPEEQITPQFKTLHIYDGGVYDNLGLEPLFDTGKQVVKKDSSVLVDFLVVSDAGAPYSRSPIPGPLHPERLKRVADIAFDQSRALRLRSLFNYFNNNAGAGTYLQIGSNPIDSILQHEKWDFASSDYLNSYSWLSIDDISAAATYKTTLSQMNEEDFDLIERHGYETAMWNELLLQHAEKAGN